MRTALNEPDSQQLAMLKARYRLAYQAAMRARLELEKFRRELRRKKDKLRRAMSGV